MFLVARKVLKWDEESLRPAGGYSHRFQAQICYHAGVRGAMAFLCCYVPGSRHLKHHPVTCIFASTLEIQCIDSAFLREMDYMRTTEHKCSRSIACLSARSKHTCSPYEHCLSYPYLSHPQLAIVVCHKSLATVQPCAACGRDHVPRPVP
jgi:hypothetical protein